MTYVIEIDIYDAQYKNDDSSIWFTPPHFSMWEEGPLPGDTVKLWREETNINCDLRPLEKISVTYPETFFRVFENMLHKPEKGVRKFSFLYFYTRETFFKFLYWLYY